MKRLGVGGGSRTEEGQEGSQSLRHLESHVVSIPSPYITNTPHIIIPNPQWLANKANEYKTDDETDPMFCSPLLVHVSSSFKSVGTYTQ